MSGALDRSRPPAPGKLKPFSFPEFEHRRPAPGIDLYLAPSARTPLVYLELSMQTGAQSDPAGRAGLTALVAALLDEGTATRSALDIARDAERLGGYLATGADWDTISLSTSLLGSHLEPAFALLAEALLEPSFPTGEIERLRQQTLAELRNRRVQPSAVARRHFVGRLYGDSPYGRFLLGDEAGVEAISREDVVGFYDAHVRPADLALVAVGSFEPAALEALVLERLAGGARRPPTAPPAIVPSPLERLEVLIVDRPGAAQTELRLGHAGIPRDHPDWTAATVMNSILGGKFMSRINLNLRERNGYTYGANSHFARRRGPGPFVVSTAVDTDKAAAAAREVVLEIERIRAEPVEHHELEDSRNYILGAFPYTVQTISGVASRLDELAVYGLPDDYYAKMPERLLALSRDDVLRAARAHLDPERLLVVAVGPREPLEESFAGLGELRVATAPPPSPGPPTD